MTVVCLVTRLEVTCCRSNKYPSIEALDTIFNVERQGRIDKDGNPVLLSTQGLLERTGARAASEVGDRVVSPIVRILVPIAAIIAVAYASIKLFGVWKRQQQSLAAEKPSSSSS